MKKELLVIGLLILGSFQISYGQKASANFTSEETESTLERDKLVSINGRCIEGGVYINLKMLNESKGGFYSLVKEFPDGSFESVEIKDIAVNTIDQPLLYSFADKDLPEVNVSYILYRISFDSEEVQRWYYCPMEQELCPEMNFTQNIK